MDYSKYTGIILTNYITIVAAAIGGIVFLTGAVVYLVREFINTNSEQGERKIIFFNNKDSAICFIGIVVFVIFLILILFWSRNVFADIPHAINNDFLITQGVVVSQDAGGREDIDESRGFELRDFETGEVLRLYVFYTPIRDGEIYEVIYLPHTKAGAIVRKLEKDELP